MTVRVRCAVYTRKSSEEGLEQSFNSLDAQREACEAYILSQRHEGWHVVATRYDDGGFSGGNMERPGLKKLLDDIAAKRVDTVVVYKVDRLTRSLADFACRKPERSPKDGATKYCRSSGAPPVQSIIRLADSRETMIVEFVPWPHSQFHQLGGSSLYWELP